MKKALTSSLVIFLVLTLALPAWAGRRHHPRPHHPPRHHGGHHHKVQLHAVGAGLLGLGLVTGAAIAAGALHQPKVVVHHHTPPPHPRPAPPHWNCIPHRHHKHGDCYELGAAQVTAQLLNVRQNPGGHFPVIMQVPCGTYLSVRATSDGWLFVSLADGRVGWVMKRHTTWGRPYADG
jgi:hypothetical protein